MYSLKFLAPLLFSLALASFSVFAAEDMDVDLSDSLDFEAFHKDKKEAVKLWDAKEVKKTYENEDTPPASATDQPATTAVPADTSAPTTDTASSKGNRYEIRELYSISGSKRTGYTPNTVVQALFLQMQGYCPNGWKKLDERSVPDGGDAFYMYYSFECL